MRQGICLVCGGKFALTKTGTLRHHLGSEYDGRWRQVCKGVGQPPRSEDYSYMVTFTEEEVAQLLKATPEGGTTTEFIQNAALRMARTALEQR